MVTNTLKIMRATMLLSATSNGVGVNVRLGGYGLSVFKFQGIYTSGFKSSRLADPLTLVSLSKSLGHHPL